jgi:hypothetical protein
LVPRLRRGLRARTLTAQAMACEPLNSVGTQATRNGDCQCAEGPSYPACSRHVVYFAQVSVPPQLGNW